MCNSVYSTPIVANDMLYIANKDHLFAIGAPAQKRRRRAAESSAVPDSVLASGRRKPPGITAPRQGLQRYATLPAGLDRPLAI